MKYTLNKLPVKTTNGFKINDVTLDFNLPKFLKLNDFIFEGDISSLKIKKEVKKDILTSKIGLDFKDYYDVEITIPKNVVINNPIQIKYDFLKEDVFSSKIHFIYEEGSKCHFILTMKSCDETSHFNYLVEDTISHKNSSGSITYINLMNSKSNHFYALENSLYEESNIIHTIIDLGGQNRLYNVYSNLLEENCKNSINTIYLGLKEELLDFNYYLNNIAPKSNNSMKVEGVLGEKSHKNFRGTIDFKKGCSASIGEENENCILLSDTCRSRSLPQLLCAEEDVVGSHGVSSGKVAEDKLFYLMSRGYSQKDAEKLIVMGNFSKIISNIPDEKIQELVLSIIDEKI